MGALRWISSVHFFSRFAPSKVCDSHHAAVCARLTQISALEVVIWVSLWSLLEESAATNFVLNWEWSTLVVITKREDCRLRVRLSNMWSHLMVSAMRWALRWTPWRTLKIKKGICGASPAEKPTLHSCETHIIRRNSAVTKWNCVRLRILPVLELPTPQFFGRIVRKRTLNLLHTNAACWCSHKIDQIDH